MQQIINLWNTFITALDNFGWGSFLILLLIDVIIWRVSRVLGIIAIILTILYVFHLI